jgi:hypothetical protein
MDLALELGTTAEGLKAQMTERELGQWRRYAVRRWFPMRRFELLLANIARMTAGAESIAPFVFDSQLREMLEPKAVATVGQAAAAIGALTGVGMVRLGQKKVIPRG